MRSDDSGPRKQPSDFRRHLVNVSVDSGKREIDAWQQRDLLREPPGMFDEGGLPRPFIRLSLAYPPGYDSGGC